MFAAARWSDRCDRLARIDDELPRRGANGRAASHARVHAHTLASRERAIAADHDRACRISFSQVFSTRRAERAHRPRREHRCGRSRRAARRRMAAIERAGTHLAPSARAAARADPLAMLHGFAGHLLSETFLERQSAAQLAEAAWLDERRSAPRRVAKSASGRLVRLRACGRCSTPARPLVDAARVSQRPTDVDSAGRHRRRHPASMAAAPSRCSSRPGGEPLDPLWRAAVTQALQRRAAGACSSTVPACASIDAVAPVCAPLCRIRSRSRARSTPTPSRRSGASSARRRSRQIRATRVAPRARRRLRSPRHRRVPLAADGVLDGVDRRPSRADRERPRDSALRRATRRTTPSNKR